MGMCMIWCGILCRLGVLIHSSSGGAGVYVVHTMYI